jgi:outer membrane lipoprotein-sorting protein
MNVSLDSHKITALENKSEVAIYDQKNNQVKSCESSPNKSLNKFKKIMGKTNKNTNKKPSNKNKHENEESNVFNLSTRSLSDSKDYTIKQEDIL